MVTESIFDTGKIRLNYAEGGTRGKPAMVFLHGLTGRWQQYSDDFEAYGKDWHIYALDLRGHGRSGKPDEGYTLPEYAEDVSAFLRRAVGEPVVLAGHSLGALVTLTVGCSAPDTVRGLIANDPPLLGADLGIDDYPEAKMWFSWVYETMKTKPDFEQVLTACKTASPDVGEAELRAMAEQVYGVAPGTVKIALEDRQKEGIDLQASLRLIRCPTLLLYGDFKCGSVVRQQDADEFQQLVPQAAVHKVPGGTHMLWWEQSETVRGLVQTFLNTIG